jgi:hypothetical protein
LFSPIIIFYTFFFIMVTSNVLHDGILSSCNTKINMSEEPTHLVGKASCPRCYSKDVVFKYYNNKNIAQPRYLCNNCKRYYTHGGTFRKSKPVGKIRPNPNVELVEGASGERDLVHENIEEMETENKDVDINVDQGSTQQRETKCASPKDESRQMHHKLDLPTKRKKTTTLRTWVDNLIWQP